MNEQIIKAAQEYIARRDRKARPDGRNDSGGRWYPSDKERCDCCSTIRMPSRNWPLSLLTHCRSVAHIARLYGVDAAEVRREVRRLDTENKVLAAA